MNRQIDYRSILYQGLWEEWERLNEHLRLVHYLPAEAAISVIKNQQIWMRSVACQNDYSEVKHGIDLLKEQVKNNRDLLNSIFKEEVVSAAIETFDEYVHRLKHDTFICCVSEQQTDESLIGRLSMWRAYGQNSGVAIVLKAKPFLTGDIESDLQMLPVIYKDDYKFEKFFKESLNVWKKKKCTIQHIHRAVRCGGLMKFFMALVSCTKHPAFAEEKEWRLIYRPFEYEHEEPYENEARDLLATPPDYMTAGVETIRGVPQLIYKFCLKKFFKMETGYLNELIDRVIIGPTKFPIQIKDALVHELTLKGVKNASNMVTISDIPLRE